MKIAIITDIGSCYECPHSTNSSIEHDDAFTSAPHPTIWWCTAHNGWEMLIIDNNSIIHPDCPMNKEK